MTEQTSGHETKYVTRFRYLNLLDDRFLVGEVVGRVAAVRAHPGREPPLRGGELLAHVLRLPHRELAGLHEVLHAHPEAMDAVVIRLVVPAAADAPDAPDAPAAPSRRW